MNIKVMAENPKNLMIEQFDQTCSPSSTFLIDIFYPLGEPILAHRLRCGQVTGVHYSFGANLNISVVSWVGGHTSLGP